ncbi:hypothetical protein [Streptomyces cyaneofuscatus]|uniref:hypothetical protein n=1 Tax=Streptomyces cyaneofuscatus TaxID=66883 RepID=UPI002F90D583|nr:hypothetical protein OG973_37090 [Streptomyces cyaneofuscatus]
MSNLEYATGVVLVVITIALIVATPFAFVHSRSLHDHGPACWWCHPRLLPRRRR